MRRCFKVIKKNKIIIIQPIREYFKPKGQSDNHNLNFGRVWQCDTDDLPVMHNVFTCAINKYAVCSYVCFFTSTIQPFSPANTSVLHSHFSELPFLHLRLEKKKSGFVDAGPVFNRNALCWAVLFHSEVRVQSNQAIMTLGLCGSWWSRRAIFEREHVKYSWQKIQCLRHIFCLTAFPPVSLALLFNFTVCLLTALFSILWNAEIGKEKN